MNFKTLVRLRNFRNYWMNYKLLLVINAGGLIAASHLRVGTSAFGTLGDVVW